MHARVWYVLESYRRRTIQFGAKMSYNGPQERGSSTHRTQTRLPTLCNENESTSLNNLVRELRRKQGPRRIWRRRRPTLCQGSSPFVLQQFWYPLIEVQFRSNELVPETADDTAQSFINLSGFLQYAGWRWIGIKGMIF